MYHRMKNETRRLRDKGYTLVSIFQMDSDLPTGLSPNDVT